MVKVSVWIGVAVAGCAGFVGWGVKVKVKGSEGHGSLAIMPSLIRIPRNYTGEKNDASASTQVAFEVDAEREVQKHVPNIDAHVKKVLAHVLKDAGVPHKSNVETGSGLDLHGAAAETGNQTRADYLDVNQAAAKGFISEDVSNRSDAPVTGSSILMNSSGSLQQSAIAYARANPPSKEKSVKKVKQKITRKMKQYYKSRMAIIFGIMALLVLLAPVMLGLFAKRIPVDEEKFEHAEMPHAKYIAEFIGTFSLVFTVGCNSIGGNATWGVASIGSVLAVSIYALGGASGAHFNPAVSLCVALSGFNELHNWSVTVGYMVVQFIAGFAAVILYSTLYPRELAAAHQMSWGPQSDFGWIEAGACEVLFTALLCFVILNVAYSPDTDNCPNQFYGLAIGFVILAGGYAAGPVSGGVFNPAIAVGAELGSVVYKVHDGERTHVCWCFGYLLCEFLGAALASMLHRVARPKEYHLEFSHATYHALACEFLGTFFLLLTATCNILNGSPAGALSIAACLMSIIFAMGNVSGGHFNPAVSVAVVLSRRGLMKKKQVPGYILVQTLGGTLGAAMSVSIFGSSQSLLPGTKFGWYAVGVSECFFTFVLCFVVLSVATTKAPLKDFFGWAIGSCVIVGGVAIGNISGGSLNPAVSFALNTTDAIYSGSSDLWKNCLLYASFEFIGAAIAVVAFKLSQPSEFINFERDDDGVPDIAFDGRGDDGKFHFMGEVVKDEDEEQIKALKTELQAARKKIEELGGTVDPAAAGAEADGTAATPSDFASLAPPQLPRLAAGTTEELQKN